MIINGLMLAYLTIASVLWGSMLPCLFWKATPIDVLVNLIVCLFVFMGINFIILDSLGAQDIFIFIFPIEAILIMLAAKRRGAIDSSELTQKISAAIIVILVISFIIFSMKNLGGLLLNLTEKEMVFMFGFFLLNSICLFIFVFYFFCKKVFMKK